VILGGSNDTMLGIEPTVTINNLNRMVDLARAAHAEPILSEIPPIYAEDGKFDGKVHYLNQQIVRLAELKQLKPR